MLTSKNNQLSSEKARAMKTIQKQEDAIKKQQVALKEKDDEIRRLKAQLASK